MIDSVCFLTRARTIDHLGREQIADCPTAISELWKNAYDAYAEQVSLSVYDGENSIAVLADDGHGMSKIEFASKWLVVGTESKASMGVVSEEDRNGLPVRPKQGQKGIGRLSSAFLGPLLLIVSKRKNEDFVAALIDWRVFENPFLYLQDIEIPVVGFVEKEEIFSLIPSMLNQLHGNIRGAGKDSTRDGRVVEGWQRFDALEESEGKPSTRQQMEATFDSVSFHERHFSSWPLWSGQKDRGTIMLISDIVFDLEVLNEKNVKPEDQDAAVQAQQRLFQTLCNFTDPFSDNDDLKNGYGAQEFEYSVTAWEGGLKRPIISSAREFDVSNLEDLEHVVNGSVDEHGVFRGKIKAFGNWLDEEVVIAPKGQVSTRSNSRVGPFHIRLGTFQQIGSSSSHPPEVHRKLLEQSEKYGGVMVYRNGLRVMPYGREDNDFFEIERRRSLHAGRHFWSNRRTFGRVAITRDGNPNLKDKAGREGLIDNKSVKFFRDLVENILIKTASTYFGTGSVFQQQMLPLIQEERAREKAEEERNKQRSIKRKRFRSNLRVLAPELVEICQRLNQLSERVRDVELSSLDEVVEGRENLVRLKDRFKEFSLGAPPRNLGSLEEEYNVYRFNQKYASESIAALEASLNSALDVLAPKSPGEVVKSDLSSHAAFLQLRLRKWYKEARDILEAEQHRLSGIYEERSKYFHSLTMPFVVDAESGRMSLSDALQELTTLREKVDSENSELFEPYIAAMRSLQNNIDLEHLANYGLDAVDEIREEVDRLHSLAQLGITVEIIGHEIESLELSITDGLQQLPESIKDSDAYNKISVSHEALVDRLRFLSPLKLSGPRYKSVILGSQIFEYVQNFFKDSLLESGISLKASQKFLAFTVYDQASRIFPVFINMINNSSYWVQQRQSDEYVILLDVVDDRVVISDNGPGVDEDDQKNLFTLFFSRKIRGGRGVGLHLCRANLAAGGHTIRYATESKFKLLPGANFVIEFKGASYE